MSAEPSLGRAAWFAAAFDQIERNIARAVIGRDEVIRLALITFLSGGHLLLEDVPGTGKTLLARSIARSVDGTSSRIQFTPDLLPGDVTGVNVFDQSTRSFDFRPGPVFANVIVADEVNRASPKTQSALLEVMEEGQVTVDGRTMMVPDPFMVVATQNVVERSGIYPLPVAQLDRFMIKTEIGQVGHDSALTILSEDSGGDRSAVVDPSVSADAVLEMRSVATSIHVEASVLSWIIRLAEKSRADAHVEIGLSMRACLGLVRAAKVRAAAFGRHYVIPEDVKRLLAPISAHRLVLAPRSIQAGMTSDDVVATLESVPPPATREI